MLEHGGYGINSHNASLSLVTLSSENTSSQLHTTLFHRISPTPSPIQLSTTPHNPLLNPPNTHRLQARQSKTLILRLTISLSHQCTPISQVVMMLNFHQSWRMMTKISPPERHRPLFRRDDLCEHLHHQPVTVSPHHHPQTPTTLPILKP